MKKVFIVIAVVFVLLVVIVVALPFVIDANQFKPTLESDLSTALGRTVQIGNIQLAILSGGITVDNISISDDPAFSHSPFLTAKQLTAGVALVPLIFSKKLEVSSFTVSDPGISLLRSTSGAWNFSSLGSASKSSPGNNASVADFVVHQIKISNGTMTVGTIGPGGKTQTYQNLNLNASDLSYTSQFPFQLTAKTPGNGTLSVDGKAGPINSTDASLTPLSSKITAQDVDIASTGFVDPSSGLAGVIGFNGDVASDGSKMSSKGTVTAQKIKLVAAGSASRVPVNIDYDTAYDLNLQTGSLTQGDVHIGKALARLTGMFNAAGTETTVQMKLNGTGMAVPDLEGVLPAVGVALPSGASLQSGTLDTNLAINGPVDKLVIAGPVNLANAKMAGFNLRSKLGALSSFVGLGGSGSDTDIQTLSANVHVDPSGTQAQNVNLVVPTVGTITGTANVSASGQLNCKMLAKLGGTGGAAGVVGSLLSVGSKGNSQNGIPFTIEGTTSNPVFKPDLSGIVGNVAKSGSGDASNAASAVSGILGGLINKKKSQ